MGGVYTTTTTSESLFLVSGCSSMVPTPDKGNQKHKRVGGGGGWHNNCHHPNRKKEKTKEKNVNPVYITLLYPSHHDSLSPSSIEALNVSTPWWPPPRKKSLNMDEEIKYTKTQEKNSWGILVFNDFHIKTRYYFHFFFFLIQLTCLIFTSALVVFK